ncbi:S41 family peptidase [Pseudotamlana agarivorans]|uniref:S41 family peptidase n=1 Tax=Pseudotamlana agarivorans TaxID=481183 RepID=UPI000830A179|nr:S41 family peptidase [Tamlana agarivorans]
MYILKHFPRLLFFILCFNIVLTSCSKEDTPPTPDPEEELPTPEEEGPVVLQNEVNDFVWLGLNEIYLWQDEIPNLADDKFSNTDDYYKFLNTYNSPESLFEDLLYNRSDVDKFSEIVTDYNDLENYLQGNSNSNGLDFRLYRIDDFSNDIIGVVRYVANNSDAATKDIKRGDFFISVDGQQLTIDNYVNLLFGANNTYSLGMATISNGSIMPINKSVSLTKTDFSEDPILINKVIETNGIKVGYMMLNQFINTTENNLNSKFADLKAQGVTELVLDLRYNGGGHGSTALALSSMITGQFKDDIFYHNIWNTKYQSYWEDTDPEFLINRFSDKLNDGTAINSLHLNKVYILTTSNSASSSELVINGLNPYIDVVQIGTTTFGKYVGSITVYDSPSFFSKTDINPNHTYAMQPIILKAVNSIGVSDYFNGITPDYTITYQTNSGSQVEGENILNLGILGDESEPFLAKALSLIASGTAKTNYDKLSEIKGLDVEPIANTKEFSPFGKEMIPIIETID